MIYYLIRHKLSGEYMPQSKKGRGYSHWNPNNLNHEFKLSSGVPRLVDTRRRAFNIIKNWASTPNGRRSISQNNYTGEYDDIIDIEFDGRKMEDLEIIEVELKEII